MYKYRVIYGDTDQMGVMYNANYLRLFEIGRNEYFRELGKSYRDLESQGIYLPVTESYCKYIKPARYDDIIDIHCEMEIISRASMKLRYELFIDGNRIAEGYTVHPYMRDSGRLMRLDENELEKYFGWKNELD